VQTKIASLLVRECAFVQTWVVEQVHAAPKIRQTGLYDLLFCTYLAFLSTFALDFVTLLLRI